MIALTKYARNGDAVIVHSLNRLARNLDDLRKIVRELTDKGVKVQFIKENQSDLQTRQRISNGKSDVIGDG